MPIASCGRDQAPEPDDVQRVDHRGDQGQRLAVAERQAARLQGEQPTPAIASATANHVTALIRLLQQHGREQRRAHDVHAR